MKRLLAVLILSTTLVLIAPAAFAAWLSATSGTGTALATTVNPGHAPVATQGSGTVNLTWTASTLASGAPVGGYIVVRHAGATTHTVCRVTALTCEDTEPLSAPVTYRVVPTIGTNWTGPESDPTPFTYDDVAPTPPVFTGISNDTGTSSSDQLTNVASQNLLGTAEAGSSVTVKKAATTVCTVTANGSGVFTCPVTLVSGANGYAATATDLVGNTSSTSATFTVTLDQTAPGAPVLTGISDDTGSSASDQITKTAGQTLSGTAEANSSVAVKKGATTECTATANGSGVFTCNVILTAGTNTYTAVATDRAGNTSSTSASFVVNLDQISPTGVVTFPASNGSYPNPISAFNAGCGTPTVSDICGTATDSVGVWKVEYQLKRTTDNQCMDDSGSYGTANCVGRLVATGTTSWSDVVVVANNRSFSLTVWLTDVAGNESQLSAVDFVR